MSGTRYIPGDLLSEADLAIKAGVPIGDVARRIGIEVPDLQQRLGLATKQSAESQADDKSCDLWATDALDARL
jgi:hypothetical protein